MATAVAQKKYKKIIDWIIWIIGLVIVAGGLVVIGIHLYVKNSLPTIEGDLTVSILDEDVKVTRDGAGYRILKHLMKRIYTAHKVMYKLKTASSKWIWHVAKQVEL